MERVDFEKHRADFMPQLQKLYELSADEAEEIRVAPHEALPKLAARLHYEVQIATFNSMVQTIPKIVGKILVEREAQAESERLFYARWPILGSKAEYTSTVKNSLQAYKAANPKATFQDLVEKAGIMACLSLGLSPLPPTQSAPPPAPIPPRPAGAGASPGTPLRNSKPTGIEADIAEMVRQELEEMQG